jgi:ATP-dependent DNA helicase RecQ
LHYFGEEFDNETGEGGMMDDNMRYPKKRTEAKDEAVKLLQTVAKTNEQYKSKEIINVLVGKANALIKSHRIDTQPFFGWGKDREASYWMALLRQLLVSNYLYKEIETYGVIHLTQKGKDFIENPTSFMMTEDHSYDETDSDRMDAIPKADNAVDENLFKMLKKELKRQADLQNLPPYVIFQEPSLQDMALKYPITLEELANVHGVGEGKARKYGKPFIQLIANYVEENEIFRPEDFVVRSTGSNSALKLYIIQNVDRKLALPDIAEAKGMEMSDFIKEMESIVYSGTKLNIKYWVDEIFDEDEQEELHEYFIEADSDSIDDAMNEFEGEYEEEELRLYRIKFISEVAN